jgi:hypothetical protein
MSNFLSHQVNPKQDYTEVPSFPSKNDYLQENKQQMFVSMWTKGTLIHC